MLFLFCHLKPHLRLKRNHAVFLWQLAFTIFQKYFFLVSKISFDLSCQKHSLNFIHIFIKSITQYFDLAYFYFLRPYLCLKTWALQFGMAVCDWKWLGGEEAVRKSYPAWPFPASRVASEGSSRAGAERGCGLPFVIRTSCVRCWKRSEHLLFTYDFHFRITKEDVVC